MTRGPFDPKASELPERLAIFPLPGALLLPGGRLPLNIFEPRYLRMISDALGAGRLVGMIQPQSLEGDVAQALIYRTGCAGRITSFGETEDGRFLITLSGLIRFDVVEEVESLPYRSVVADFSPYLDDLKPDRQGMDRMRFLATLKHFLERRQLSADWSAIEQAEDESLIASIAMILPFEVSEKQAILEAKDLPARAETLIAIMEMGAFEDGEGKRRQ